MGLFCGRRVVFEVGKKSVWERPGHEVCPYCGGTATPWRSGEGFTCLHCGKGYTHYEWELRKGRLGKRPREYYKVRRARDEFLYDGGEGLENW